MMLVVFSIVSVICSALDTSDHSIHGVMSKREHISSEIEKATDSKKAKNNTVLIAEERDAIRAGLVAVSRGTTATVARVLVSLQEKGLLTDEELGKSKYEAKRLSKAAKAHAHANTPYGYVVQPIELDLDNSDEKFTWDIISPFAFLWYVSSICQDLGKPAPRREDCPTCFFMGTN